MDGVPAHSKNPARQRSRHGSFTSAISTRELHIWGALLTAFLIPQACYSAASQAQADELKSCLNEGQPFSRTTWNGSILNDTLPNIRVERVWWSKRPAKFQFTVLTQLSADRMPALFNQCSTYLGPMAGVVYLPLLQTDEQGTSQLSNANRDRLTSEANRIGRVYEEIEASGGCQLDLMFVYEVFDSLQAMLLYPVNALRNLARMQVRTKLLSAIDVDMMISKTLSAELSQPGSIAELEALAAKRVATVLPAFEPQRQGVFGRTIADAVALADKHRIMQMFSARELLQFKLKVFPRGHTPTNYTWWFQTQEAYPVAYKRMFEPWFITHWNVMPWFDVNFKGYGLNKIVHVASLNYYGFTFQVHPGAWLVHRPHEDTKVRKMVAREASDVNKLAVKLPKNALYYKVTILFGQAKRGMIRGTFNPRLDERMVQCFKQLSWLQPLKELAGTPVDEKIFI